MSKFKELEELAEKVLTDEVEDPDQATVGAVLVVLEVKDKAANENVIVTFCTDKRTWIQRALLREATETVDEFVPLVDGDEDAED